jgi:hypothetical protein
MIYVDASQRSEFGILRKGCFDFRNPVRRKRAIVIRESYDFPGRML